MSDVKAASYIADMRVKRDFDQIYAADDDPWGIGEADSERYDLYVERIISGSSTRASALELGCGYGALLARLSGHFDRLVGVDVSARAVAHGRELYPFIDFRHGSLAHPAAALPEGELFDTIIVSDVLYYLKERDRRAAVGWIAEHLAPGGLAFLAGWSPGGRYLGVDEFRNLVERELAVESEEILETKHVLFRARRIRTFVALTVDYETWQPQLEGVSLDWERDVLRPTERLLDVFDEAGATLTIFAEMGEYMWLSENRPEIACQMEHQWREAVKRGHDVQLHLHPNWMPEMSPRVQGDKWDWDMERTRASEYVGDLADAIGRCKAALERAIRPAAPDYAVVAYRAGSYEAQPFDRLYDALAANEIWCDSSVLPGDRRPGRHYSYAYAYSDHQPWLANRYDPQLKAPPAERGIVELPIFAHRHGERWTFDNEMGEHFAAQLLRHVARDGRRPSSEALRLGSHLRTVLRDGYERLRPVRPIVNRLMPRRLAACMMGYERERLVANRYYVLIAHTKTALDFDAIAAGVRDLCVRQGIELISLTEMAKYARSELDSSLSQDREHESARQVQREYAGQMSNARDFAQSERLERQIPLDRERILDAGCERGLGTAALARLHPGSMVVGIDVGLDFIEKARDEFMTERISFGVEDFAELSFDDASFDCVHADNTLEYAFDIDATIGQLHRVLTDGGCLVAAIPPDGLNPDRTCDNHTWKTIPSDVQARLAAAGFVDIEIRTVDVYRELGTAPYPPSNDQMLYVTAWKRDRAIGPVDRIRELTRWTYEALDPERPQESNDPLAILAGGYAWCWGYVLLLGEALLREGYNVRWVTMIAENHPLGLGDRRRDTHEVLEVVLNGDGCVVCDPTVGVVFEASLSQLLRDPSLADAARAQDERYGARQYALYSTSAWYSRVRRVAVRRRPGARLRYVDAKRLAKRT